MVSKTLCSCFTEDQMYWVASCEGTLKCYMACINIVPILLVSLTTPSTLHSN